MRRAIIVLICFVVALLEFTPSIAQSTAPQLTDKYAEKLKVFEDFVRKQMEKDKIPGLTIGFYIGDYEWVKGFGYADLENKTPAKPESAYRLASITKPIVSVAILQLVEKGKIKLDGEIQTYVPYYPKQQWPITVRQLLAHTGGFASPQILWEEIGRKWLDAGRVDDTLALVNLALELHPREARFHSGLCEIYWRKGTKDKAAEACRKALEIDPNFAPAQELMKKLAQ